MERLRTCRKFFAVDWRMLPMKCHFFLYALGLSPVFTFQSLILKNVGISPTATGIILTMSPFITVFSNPALGWVADKLHKITLVIIGLIVIQTPLFLGCVFVPPIEHEYSHFAIKIVCSSENSYAIMSPNISFLIPNNTNIKCNLHLTDTPTDNATFCDGVLSLEVGGTLNASSDFQRIKNMSYQEVAISPSCKEDTNNTCTAICNIDSNSGEIAKSEYVSYQYWTLMFLIVSSIVLTNATIAIGDAACYEALEGKVNKFGKQRVWESIGWGSGTLLGGYALDLFGRRADGKTDYRYNALISLILLALDIVALSQATLKKPPASKHIFKDISKIYTSPHPFFFTGAVFLIGLFISALFRFQFWYLDDMGASKLLLGLSDAVTCVVAETPFIFVSGWIIKRIGRDNCMCLALLTLSVALISISFINNPWWILLINMTQGPSYGLFIIAMTSYGKISTAPGTEATIQTFLCSVYHGLGVGTGNLLSGITFESYGKISFRVYGFLSVGAAIIFKLLTSFVAGENTVKREGDLEMTNPSHEKSSDS